MTYQIVNDLNIILDLLELLRIIISY